MSVFTTGVYQGNLKMTLTHEDSGATITTAAPKDNQGDGSSFSPTDLLAAALGSCVLSTIGIVAARDGVDLRGAHYRVEKIMSADPRRVGSLDLEVHLPVILSDAHRRKYEAAAATCAVKRSLAVAIIVAIAYHYDV